MVGSSEFEESWLDEGLNDDSEHRTMTMAYGPRDTIQLPGGFGVDSISLAHAQYTHLDNLDPIRKCAWCFFSGASYGINSYYKVGLFMAQLKNDLGARAFSRAQRAYFQTWSFRHPTTSDFFDVFEKSTGRDLSEYCRNIVEGTSRLDVEGWGPEGAPPARERGSLRPCRRTGHGRRQGAQEERKGRAQDLGNDGRLRQRRRVGTRGASTPGLRERRGRQPHAPRRGPLGSAPDSPLQ